MKEGFTYSPSMTFITEFDGGFWKTQTDQKELSVVAGLSNDGEETVVQTTSIN